MIYLLCKSLRDKKNHIFLFIFLDIEERRWYKKSNITQGNAYGLEINRFNFG